MKNELKNAWVSLVQLFRFLVWYGIAVAALFYLLPLVGLFLEDQYENMSNAVKFFAVIGFFSVVVVWQVLSRRDRLRHWSDQEYLG
jgi:O-antigen/teichoic acid export membrane protein